MHLPPIITDLALMLIVAALVTLIFKKIRQPLVLGYIVAGFLIGPYFGLLPDVTDMASVSAWSEIGIIVLMFYLGLEFNLHKLASVGGAAIITALTEVAGMLVFGYAVGRAMGWTNMNCLFLGGMLAMSSTTIIIKAFDELGMRGKKFTELVFGVLVVEDIAGIFMMIVLSTISVSQNISGWALGVNLGLLLVYLAVWLLLGIYLIPSFLNRAAPLMNDETLLVASLGLCFGMVLVADKLGFSSALGAFLAGSLLAGTNHAERVEHLTTGVRDLFGAVFFISVGMMVDPALLVQYWLPILIVTLVTVFGKLLLSSGGVLISGRPLSMALSCGFSLAQIGEFAFIIASLGRSLGVTGDFLYPIVVSVSVITTFTTPFCIRLAGPFYQWLQRRLPPSLLERVNRYTDESGESGSDGAWQAYLKRYFSRTALYGVIMLAIIMAGLRLLWPWLQGITDPAAAAAGALIFIYLGLAFFIRPLLEFHDPQLVGLWLQRRANRPPLVFLAFVRVALVVALALLPLAQVFHLDSLWILPALVLAVMVLGRTGFMTSAYLRFETRFLTNFNERLLHREAGDESVSWLDEQLLVCVITAPPSLQGDKSLIQLQWGRRYGAYCVRLIRGERQLNLPGGGEKPQANDILCLLGEERQLDNVCQALGVRPETPPQTLRTFIASQSGEAADRLYCCVTQVEADAPPAGQSIRDSGLRENWDGFLLGLQRGRLPIIRPNVDMVLEPGDVIWLLGARRLAERLPQAE